MKTEISQERKTFYTIGLIITGIGFISFLSVFAFAFLGDPFQLGFNFMAPGFIGFTLIIIGQGIMTFARLGKAGSGLVLDPKQAREDLRPYSSQVGGMLNDVLDEVDLPLQSKEVVKVRCRQCQALNDEDARFCKHCGSVL